MENLFDVPPTYVNRGTAQKDWAREDQPQFKIKMKGTGALSDVELLSFLLSGSETVETARTILQACKGNIIELAKLSIADLTKFNISQSSALRIVAAFELGRRKSGAEPQQREKIANSRDAAEIFFSLIGDLPYEEFWMITMNKANRVMSKIKISEGGISGTVVDPKKVYKLALDEKCSSIIVAHNHPSGNLQPSEADHKITKKLRDCGILLDIGFLDSLIIVEGERYFSFADDGSM